MNKLNRDIIGTIIGYLQSWDDIYEYHRSNRKLYIQVLSQMCPLPWTIDADDKRSCALQKHMATTIAVFNLSKYNVENMLFSLALYHSVKTINITNCGEVSFNKAKRLINEVVIFGHDIELLESQKPNVEVAKSRIQEGQGIKLIVKDSLLVLPASPASPRSQVQQLQGQHHVNTDRINFIKYYR
ncbi:hypothetical protein BDC45DRAFT_86310 [Circinella umbellata]|nr:hypothetical protein BDC45DRAFT_86310 [Circinella umbellata]